MTSPILSALSSGYTQNQVISYLIRKFPQYKDHIKNAQAAGFSADKILKYLEKGRKGITEENPSKTEHERTRESERRTQSNQLKGAGALAASAAIPIVAPMASAALSRVAPSIASNLKNVIPAAGSALQRAAPQLFGQGSIPQHAQSLQNATHPSATQKNTSTASTNTMPQQVSNTSQPPISNQVAPNISQPQQVTQPEGIINPKEYLEKLGIKDKVDDLLKRGNTPEQAAATLGMQRGAGKVTGQIDPELLANIDAYSKEPKPEPEPIIEKDLNEEKPTIEKGSSVSSPQGIGEIKELRNGQALIDIDGKLHKVKEEDLEPPMFSDDEVADAYDNLMAKIPEEHKSGFISWAGYDEDRNVLGFIPRGGKYEELKDITPEEANIIKEGKGVARTNGETREGLWVMGEDTRGGLISQIIHDRRKANKASEEKQLKLGFEIPKPEKEDKGMKPLFDEMAHAREKSRERERKKKEEEKARKKKEKDEAKKRKK